MIAGYPYSYFTGCSPLGTLSYSATDTLPVEPLLLRDAKSFLRIDFDDDDALILSLIQAARGQAELAQRRVLAQTQFDLVFDTWPSYAIELATPVTSVDLISYTDNTGLSIPLTPSDDYIVDLCKSPAIVYPTPGTYWPSFTAAPSSSILIRFTAGYLPTDPFWSGLIGSRLKIGMLFLISDWYENRVPTGALSDKVSSLLSGGNLKRPR